MDATPGIENHLPLVRKIAADVRRSLGPSVDYDDLVSYGTRGLLEAQQRFDARRGVAFSTFAYYRIRGAIYDGVREMGWRPRSRAQRQQVRFEEGANLALQQASADGPSWEPKGEAAAVEQTIAQVAAVYMVSLQAEGAPEPADSSPGAVDRLEAATEQALVRRAVPLLPEKERRLVEMMYFEEKTLTAAGAELGLSKSWSSRLHARALQLLAAQMEKIEAVTTQPSAGAGR